MLEALFFTQEKSRLHQLLSFHPLHISSPLHPLLPGKGQAKDLKQVLLGGKPKYFSAFKKKQKRKKEERKTVCLSPPQPTFFLRALSVSRSPWFFYLSFLLRTMQISSMGGVSL